MRYENHSGPQLAEVAIVAGQCLCYTSFDGRVQCNEHIVQDDNLGPLVYSSSQCLEGARQVSFSAR